jgi:hypothetical protein
MSTLLKVLRSDQAQTKAHACPACRRLSAQVKRFSNGSFPDKIYPIERLELPMFAIVRGTLTPNQGSVAAKMTRAFKKIALTPVFSAAYDLANS